MTCPNQTKTPKWAIGFAALTGPFHEMSDGPLSDIFLVAVKCLAKVERHIHLVFHRWKGRGTVTDIYQSIEKYKHDAEGFMRRHFDSIPESCPIANIWVTYVNQYQGNTLASWPQSPSTFEKDGRKYYKSRNNPDSFCRDDPFPSNNLSFEYLTLPGEMAKNEYTGYLGKPQGDTDKIMGNFCIHQMPNTIYRIIYAPKCCSKYDINDVFYQPLCTPRDATFQVVVPILKSQREWLYRLMEKIGPMPPEALNDLLIRLSKDIGGHPIKFYRIKLDENCSNVVISMTNEETILPKTAQRVNDLPRCHYEERKKNKRDYDVKGTVIFRCYPWMFQSFITSSLVVLLRATYHSKGLIRKLCIHGGSFYMNGNRQTNEASSSMMSPASQGIYNDYYSPRTIDHTILPLIQSFINRLSQEAQQHQQTSGQHTLSLVRLVLRKLGSSVKMDQLCKGKIITFNFFNSGHKDCDGMALNISRLAKKHIDESGDPKLVQWLETFHSNFGRDYKLPMPTTCSWTSLKASSEWKHISYFLLLDVGLAYDLSSDVLDQFGKCGATFYGSLFEHCTSAPLWVTSDGKQATIVCPKEVFYNFAWGNSGNSSEQSKLVKDVEREGRSKRARDS